MTFPAAGHSLFVPAGNFHKVGFRPTADDSFPPVREPDRGAFGCRA